MTPWLWHVTAHYGWVGCVDTTHWQIDSIQYYSEVFFGCKTQTRRQHLSDCHGTARIRIRLCLRSCWQVVPRLICLHSERRSSRSFRMSTTQLNLFSCPTCITLIVSKPSRHSRKIVLCISPPVDNPCVIWPNSVSSSTHRRHQITCKFKLISGYLWTISGYIYEIASFFSPWTGHAIMVGNPVIASNLRQWMNTTANRQYLSRHIPQWPSPSNPHTIYCKTHWNRDVVP